MHPAVAEILDPLHKVRRGQQWLIMKVSMYLVMSSVWKLVDIIRTYFALTQQFAAIET